MKKVLAIALLATLPALASDPLLPEARKVAGALPGKLLAVLTAEIGTRGTGGRHLRLPRQGPANGQGRRRGIGLGGAAREPEQPQSEGRARRMGSARFSRSSTVAPRRARARPRWKRARSSPRAGRRATAT